MARLSAPRPDGARRRGAPRLRVRTCGGAPAGEKSSHPASGRTRMRFGEPLRRYWPEMLLFLAVALPWLSLLALGSLWLWQGGHVWVWSIATAILGLLAWPLSRFVQRRGKSEAPPALVGLG